MDRRREDDPLGETRPIAPPLYNSSVYAVPDLDALDRIISRGHPGFIYARDAHPNGESLGRKMAAVEGGEWAVAAASGMAALATTMLTLCRAGDRVVASDNLYGRSTQLLQQELARFGVTTTFVNTSVPETVRRAIDGKTRAVLVETISNPLLRLTDIAALAEITEPRDCALVVDNTFATPVLCRPLQLGAAAVVESLTKLVGGHSDLTLGLIAGRDLELAEQIRQVMTIWGFAPPAFDCWLAERSLPTLTLRAQIASQTAAELAAWLVGQPAVETVSYPGLPDHPDHELAGKLLPEGCGSMIAFELAGGRDAVNRLFRRCPEILFCPSLGHTGTTFSYPAATSHRTMPPAERKRLGISDGLVRLSVGLEPLDWLKRELTKGLK